jgi:hypothetical protein
MTLSKTILRALLAFIAICVAQVVAGVLVPMKPVAIPHMLLWTLLSTAVTVAALSLLAASTDSRGWLLGAEVAAIPLAVFSIDMIEGVVFLPNIGLNWGRLFLYMLVAALLSIPVWALLFGTRKDDAPAHYRPIRAKSRGERAWKFALCDLTYLFLYFAAGTIIFPYVKDFYATQHLPAMGRIVALQLFVRGPLFVLLALALTRMLGLPRMSGALAVGVVFALLTGVAPLLMPNPYFPDAVRWVHFAEVTSENFVFAVVVAWLWGPPKLALAQALRQAA